MAKSKYPAGFGNYILYRMCEEQPDHTDADVVEGKIWLIGRAYAAAIERGADNAGPKLYGQIAAKIVKSNLDGWLASIGEIKHVDTSSVGRVLAVHRKFVDLLKKLAGGKRTTRRSFASKYLHFHHPRHSSFLIVRQTRRFAVGVRNCLVRPRSSHPVRRRLARQL
jgi:hypothetical protein